MKRICVYAGSNPGASPAFGQAAVQLGEALVRRGLELVYGGSRAGLMGAVADSVLARGGRVIGVMPRGLFRAEAAHPGLSEFRETAGMHERKAEMAALSDAFIALPGGFGTFEEIFESVSWSQIGIHTKPVGLLNVGGFYEPLREMIAHTARAGFIRPTHAGLLVIEDDSDRLLDALARFERPVTSDKWDA